METQEITKTTEYDSFKNFSYNRKKGVNKKKLQELIDSIKENNYLHLHPIIVDSNFNVIDGQHRLRAAKTLNVPVFYVQEDNISEKHVMNANTAQSSWSIEDIINFFAVKEQDTQYLRLNELMEELDLKPKGLLGLLFGVCNKQMIDLIKRGNFKFPENDSNTESLVNNYKKFKEFVDNRRIRPKTMFSNALFTQAFRLMVINETFNAPLFFKKLENRWYELKPQINSQEWFNLLIKIYNWHNKEKISNGSSWEE